MKITTLLFLFLATGYIALAQPGSYREKQNNEYKRLGESTQRAYNVPSSSSSSSGYKSTSNSGNNSSSSTSSGSSYIYNNNTPAPTFRTQKMIEADLAQKRIDDAEEAKRQQIYAAEKAKSDREYEIWNTKRIYSKLDEKDAYMEATTLRDANRAIDKRDVNEHNQDRLFQETVKNIEIDRTDAENAYTIFMKEYSSASYDSLYNWVWRMRVFPFSTSQCLKLMNSSFPDKTTEIELLELKTMPYYFGAVRPNLTRVSNDYPLFYPETMIQNPIIKKNVEDGIIKRFIELDKKYPPEGAIAAGFCRAECNPYVIYADWNISPEITAEYHIKNLYRPVAVRGRDFIGFAVNDGDTRHIPAQTERQIGKSARWLVNNRPEWLENLSKEQWIAIARAQHIRPYYLGQVFKTEDSKNVFPKDYKNLNKTIKNFKF